MALSPIMLLNLPHLITITSMAMITVIQVITTIPHNLPSLATKLVLLLVMTILTLVSSCDHTIFMLIQINNIILYYIPLNYEVYV